MPHRHWNVVRFDSIFHRLTRFGVVLRDDVDEPDSGFSCRNELFCDTDRRGEGRGDAGIADDGGSEPFRNSSGEIDESSDFHIGDGFDRVTIFAVGGDAGWSDPASDLVRFRHGDRVCGSGVEPGFIVFRGVFDDGLRQPLDDGHLVDLYVFSLADVASLDHVDVGRQSDSDPENAIGSQQLDFGDFPMVTNLADLPDGVCIPSDFEPGDQQSHRGRGLFYGGMDSFRSICTGSLPGSSPGYSIDVSTHPFEIPALCGESFYLEGFHVPVRGFQADGIERRVVGVGDAGLHGLFIWHLVESHVISGR